MPSTTSLTTSHSFESIDIAILLGVQGGCGKKQQACCNCAPQALASPAPAVAPAPMAPPPRPRDSISTSISVSYQ